MRDTGHACQLCAYKYIRTWTIDTISFLPSMFLRIGNHDNPIQTEINFTAADGLQRGSSIPFQIEIICCCLAFDR